MRTLFAVICLLCALGGALHCATVISSDITTDTTLYMSNNPHQIRGNIKVLNGATLTIEPGVNVFFEANSSLTVEGSVSAMGTAVQPIVFSSLEYADYYTRLIFSTAENSSLDHCSLGRSDDWTGLLRIENSSNINITNSSLGSSVYSHGIYINNSSVDITNLDMSNIAGSGIYVTGNSVVNLFSLYVDGCATGVRVPNGAYPTLNWDDVVVHHSTSYPIIANMANLAGLNGLGVAWAGIGMVLMWDTAVYASHTLPYHSIPYCVEGSLTFSGNGATLTLEPGVGIRFNQHGGLSIENGAALVADGTAALPVSFAPAAASTWRGISFSPNTTGLLDYCQFSGCGYPQYGYPEPSINVNGAASLSISNTTIPGGTTYGIYWDGSNAGALNLNNVSIVDCPWTGLYIRNSYMSVDYSNLSISGCGSPIALPANLLDFLDEQPGFTSNTDNRIFIHIDGTVRRNTTIRDWGYPYVSEGVDITTNYVGLVIQPGCEFQMGYSMGFNCNGTVSAVGTADLPILFTRLPGSTQNWRGFYLNAGITFAQFDHCILEHCASSNQYNHVQNAFHLYRADTVIIQNTQIIDAYCRAVYLESTDSDQDDLTVTNLSINGCGMDAFYQSASDYALSMDGISINACNAYPLSISANWAHQLNGVTLTNNAFNVIRCVNGGRLASQTLANHGYPYQISGANLQVYYTNVTFQPGTVFYFERYRGLEIYGTLAASGTAEHPVVFDRPPDAAYFWDRIYLSNNSNASFAWCHILNGGEHNQYGYDNGMMENAGATLLSLQNCQIANVDAQAIRCADIGSGDALQISNVQITGCRTDGLWINDSDLALTASGLTISSCLRNPLAILPRFAGSFSGLILSGNTNNNILLFGDGYLYGSANFPNHGYVYRCETSIYGNNGSSVSIAPGCEFWMPANQYMAFSGAISAVGTAGAPIVFTRHPSSSGYWRGIVLYNSCWDADFAHCSILYAGAQDDYGQRRAIHDSGASNVSFTDCLIQDSYGDGIVCTDIQSTDVLTLSGVDLHNLGWSGFVAVNVPYFGFSADGLDIAGVGGEPINCSADLMDRFSNITITGAGNPYIVVSSAYQTRSATWPNLGLPYKLNNSLTVNDWVTLTLAAGTELVFADYVLYQHETCLQVYGALNTLGSLEAPVTFRGMDPAAPSTWEGIKINSPDAVCNLGYATILNAGLDQNYSPADEFCALYAYNGTLNLTGCHIAVSNHNLLKLEGNVAAALVDCQFDSAVNGIIQTSGNLSILRTTITALSGTGAIHNGGTIAFGSEPAQWNRIYGNTWNLRNNSAATVLAPYIHWGSTDPAVIDASVWDNEEGGGTVNFEPWYDLNCVQLYYYSVDVPQGVGLALQPAGNLRLSWNAVSGATSYKVLAADAPSASAWDVLQQNIGGTWLDITPTAGEATKFYKVVAVR